MELQNIAPVNLTIVQLIISRLLSNKEALEISQEIGDLVGEAYARYNLAQLLWILRETQTALQHCRLAVSITSDLSLPLQTECEELLKQLEQSNPKEE